MCRHMWGQRRHQLRRILTEDDRLAGMPGQRCGQRCEIRPLADAAPQPDQSPSQGLAQSGDGRQRRAHVSAFGIVDPANATALGNYFAAMRQSGKVPEYLAHDRQRQSDDMPDRHRGQRVGLIVTPRQTQLADRHQRLLAVAQPLAGLERRDAPHPVRGGLRREALAGYRRILRPCCLVFGIDHDVPGLVEDSRLDLPIAGHVAMPVEVVGGQVEEGSAHGTQPLERLELETRQLQHEQFGIGMIDQQIERRVAQVASHGDPFAGLPRHVADQRGHRGLGVRSGNGDYWRFAVASE